MNLNKKMVDIVLSATLINIYAPVLGEINQTGQRMKKQKVRKRKKKKRPQNQIGMQIGRRHRTIGPESLPQ